MLGSAGWAKVEDGEAEEKAPYVASSSTSSSAAGNGGMGLSIFAKFGFMVVVVGAVGVFLKTRKSQRYSLLSSSA